MNVYAKLIKDENLNLEFRRNTILQFGDSWDVIGNVILINPGSANPKSSIEEAEIERISSVFKEKVNRNEWFKFNPDSTMRQIEKLFNGGYFKANPHQEYPYKKLNGVIRLFNLFNLKDANLEQALIKVEGCETENMFTLSEDIELIGDEPLYVGWGKVGLGQRGYNKNTREMLYAYANKAFDQIKEKNKGNYLDDNFHNNSFYHPGFINRSYSTYSKNLLHKFAEKELNYHYDL